MKLTREYRVVLLDHGVMVEASMTDYDDPKKPQSIMSMTAYTNIDAATEYLRKDTESYLKRRVLETVPHPIK